MLRGIFVFGQPTNYFLDLCMNNKMTHQTPPSWQRGEILSYHSREMVIHTLCNFVEQYIGPTYLRKEKKPSVLFQSFLSHVHVYKNEWLSLIKITTAFLVFVVQNEVIVINLWT